MRERFIPNHPRRIIRGEVYSPFEFIEGKPTIPHDSLLQKRQENRERIAREQDKTHKELNGTERQRKREMRRYYD